MSAADAPAGPSEKRRTPLAERIISARRALGLTQTQVADAVQVSQSAMADYETGRSRPSYRVMERLADYFKMTTSELITGERPPSNSKNTTRSDLSTYTDSADNDAAFAKLSQGLHDASISAGTRLEDIDVARNAFAARGLWRAVMNMPPEMSMDARVTAIIATFDVIGDIMRRRMDEGKDPTQYDEDLAHALKGTKPG